MEGEGLALEEGTLGAEEADVPEGEVVVRKEHLHLLVVLLDGLVLLLQALAHTEGHGDMNIYYLSLRQQE